MLSIVDQAENLDAWAQSHYCELMRVIDRSCAGAKQNMCMYNSICTIICIKCSWKRLNYIFCCDYINLIEDSK